MNYASLNASLAPKQTKPVQKNNAVSLTYNPNPPRSNLSSATSSATPNTIMSRDSTGSTKVSSMNVHSKLNVTDGATISGGATINGLVKMNGTIDTSLGAGFVCSNSIGVLSIKTQITSADIANLTVKGQDICDDAITTPKLAPNLFLSGTPTCEYTNVVGENQITNVGYVNRFVTKYVNNRLSYFTPKLEDSSRCHVNDSDSDEEELDPSVFHVKTNDYLLKFNYATYIIENATAIINMPRKKKEGYYVKFHNKSGDTIFINSSADRLMYNASYSPFGTESQAIETNRCAIFTYVYSGTVRSWSYQCF